MSNPYTPNIFVRIGFFLLTVIALACGLGLLFLGVLSHDKDMGWVTLFYGICVTVALELMIAQKHHFRSGVDDALLYSAAACIYFGIGIISNGGSDIGAWTLALLIFAAGTLRYGDSLMALGIYISLAGIIYSSNLGIFKPYALIALSAILRVLASSINNQPYSQSLTTISISSLLGLYAAGNIYIVQEQVGAAKPAIFFWIWTIAIPVVYGYLGIGRKDRILVWSCLLLIAVTAFTIRYYHHFLEIEWMLTICGIVLITVSSLLTRYLRIPRKGITSVEDKDADMFGRRQVEAIIVATTFSTDTAGPGPNTTQFGGGSGGGGGASSSF